MIYIQRFLLALAIPFLVAAQIEAAGVLIYTGQPFTFVDAGPGMVTGEFEVTIPLTDGAMLTEADISSWSLSAAGVTIDSDHTFIQLFDFAATIGPTSGALVPIAWNITVRADVAGDITGPVEQLSTIYDPFNSISIDNIIIDAFGPSPTTSSVRASGTPTTQGSWAAIPEPSGSLYMFLVGVGLAFRNWLSRRWIQG